jgi:hypothetical protein
MDERRVTTWSKDELRKIAEIAEVDDLHIALRYLGPGGDLQHTNVGKAVFAEQSKGCFEHAFTS